MFKAILFDLDGTLLDIDMKFFLGKYFREMGNMAAARGYDGRQLIEQILESTWVMIEDSNPDVSNEEIFMQHLFSSFEVDVDEMKAFFADFYRTGFPRLKGYCQPFDVVPPMMEQLSKRGFKVVIATNAVFPLTAIQQRLDWAGVGNYRYELVTSYENMHYCKPKPCYYKEIADHIGVAPSACLMVGNDIEEDLVAGEVGMKTFLVEDRLIDGGKNKYSPDWKGNLHQLWDFLGNIAKDKPAGTGT